MSDNQTDTEEIQNETTFVIEPADLSVHDNLQPNEQQQEIICNSFNVFRATKIILQHMVYKHINKLLPDRLSFAELIRYTYLMINDTNVDFSQFRIPNSFMSFHELMEVCLSNLNIYTFDHRCFELSNEQNTRREQQIKQEIVNTELPKYEQQYWIELKNVSEKGEEICNWNSCSSKAKVKPPDTHEYSFCKRHCDTQRKRKYEIKVKSASFIKKHPRYKDISRCLGNMKNGERCNKVCRFANKHNPQFCRTHDPFMNKNQEDNFLKSCKDKDFNWLKKNIKTVSGITIIRSIIANV